MQPTPGLQIMDEGSMGSGMSENEATLLKMLLQLLQPLQFFARTRTLNTQDDRASPDKL
jgi:hypothetical protein